MRRSVPVPKFVVSLSEGEQPLISSPVDLRQTVVESFLAARELQPNSVRSYQQDLQQFMDYCDCRNSFELRSQTISIPEFPTPYTA